VVQKVSAVAQESHFHCDFRACFATAFRNWRLKSNFPLKKVASDLGVHYQIHTNRVNPPAESYASIVQPIG
jgi:hypothetical protein